MASGAGGFGDGLAEMVGDLEAEQRAVQDCVRDLDDDAWLTPVPSWGWDVRDTVAHLADTDEVALDTMTGGPRPLNELVSQCVSAEDVTFLGVMRGRKMRGTQVLEWYERTSAAERAALVALDPSVRVPWGLGMRANSFVTARLMETWAHGLDVRAALGLPDSDTDRLAHVAWLATRALPYAYSVAGREPVEGALRVELTLPSGATWTSGPEDASSRISGPASQYCRVFVQRLPLAQAVDLMAEGDAAVAALEVARAYL